MTSRLYYTDAYLTEFEAQVVALETWPDGRAGVVLDRTAFYPTSGGQPFDTGTLGHARVVDVVDRPDGSVVHVVEGPRPEGRVAGRIDWPRRFEHMQQHTGQHVLSAAFERSPGVRTVSFHLGTAASTIDLFREVTGAEIGLVEDQANAIVWEDRPVEVRFVDEAEAARLPLRKEPARQGRLRIVDIDGFDLSACGGTHVARTGAIGMIAVSGWEKFRGGTRVEFACGLRAARAWRTARDSVAACTRLIPVAPGELAQGIERLQSDNRELRRQVRDLEARLAADEAERLAARAEDMTPGRIVLECVDVPDANGLRAIAQRIAGRPGHAAVLVTAVPPLSIVIARAPDVAVDAAAVLKTLTARLGGRGGGRSDLAQGGGLNGPAEDVLAAAKEHIGAQAG